jgi:hypothetical protein
MKHVLLGAAALLLVTAAPLRAQAVVRAQSDYPYDQVWNAALRLIRVDLGFEVTERDSEGGYVLFKYQGETGIFNASIEILRLTGGKVGIVCQIPQMPRYAEIFMVDRLNRKMRDEYGAPPLHPTPPPAMPPSTPAPPRSGARNGQHAPSR